jgi:hypothetical protein
MSIPIPPDFDYLKEQVDVSEQMARDGFHLKVENWAKFHWTIAVGNESVHLSGASVSEDVKGAYRELGKCHHEVVSSLGYSRYCYQDIMFGNLFVFQKGVKDFYFHGGAMLDNLSRLIYIVNVPDAATAKKSNGQYRRHLIDRGALLDKYSAHIGPYIPHLDNTLINEFVAVRNAHAHYWKIPWHDLKWPRDQLQDKAFAWHYDESAYHNYSGWQPITQIIEEHFKELEKTQDAVFALLVNDIAKFETNNGVIIV